MQTVQNIRDKPVSNAMVEFQDIVSGFPSEPYVYALIFIPLLIFSYLIMSFKWHSDFFPGARTHPKYLIKRYYHQLSKTHSKISAVILFFNYSYRTYPKRIPKLSHQYPAASIGFTAGSLSAIVLWFTSTDTVVVVTLFYASVIFMSQFLGNKNPYLTLRYSRTCPTKDGIKFEIDIVNGGDKDVLDTDIKYKIYDRHGVPLSSWKYIRKNYGDSIFDTIRIDSGDEIENLYIDLSDIEGATTKRDEENERYTEFSNPQSSFPIFIHIQAKPKGVFSYLGVDRIQRLRFPNDNIKRQ